MDSQWQTIARRIVHGLAVERGELVLVRDLSGHLEVLLETMLALEQAGATPLPELAPADYMERLWAEVPLDILGDWDRYRRGWMRQVHRILVLGGAQPDFGGVPAEGFRAWQRAEQQLTAIEEERRLPFLLVAVPTKRGARQLGLDLHSLQKILMPALAATVEELRSEIDRVLTAARSQGKILIHTGGDHELSLMHGDRRWLSDDGHIDPTDRAQGGIVSNLPAGSIYTTVLEDQTEGTLWLPKAGPAVEVLLHFETGRIAHIEAVTGADSLAEELDRHSGEPRRVGHIGIGLNPYLERPIGWTLVDEHVHGFLFISLGENRYMAGENPSSLNADYAIPGATLSVDGRTIVSNGKVVV
jgi:leucyl aminopeptidase (aminopeptidase T)